MAKCIQRQGVPVRMSGEDAFQVVERDRDGQYCPKHVWRASTGHFIAKLEHGHIRETSTLARRDQHAR